MKQARAFPEPARVGHFRVAHTLPRRVRLKSPLLADPAFDAVYFQALLESLGGVTEARVNAAGRSLVVAYDGQPATWEKIAFNLKHMPEEAFPADHDAEQTVSGAAVTAKALLTLVSQALPPPCHGSPGLGHGRRGHHQRHRKSYFPRHYCGDS